MGSFVVSLAGFMWTVWSKSIYSKATEAGH